MACRRACDAVGRRRRSAAPRPRASRTDGAIGTSVPGSGECVVDRSGELTLKRVRSSHALNHSAIRRARQSSRPCDAASPRRLPSRKRRQALDTLPYDPAHDGLQGLPSLLHDSTQGAGSSTLINVCSLSHPLEVRIIDGQPGAPGDPGRAAPCASSRILSASRTLRREVRALAP